MYILYSIVWVSELLDNKVNAVNDNLKTKILGFQALRKCAMKVKVEENATAV